MAFMKRYVSLDVLRGLTVAMMIVVNNPGSWSRIYPPLRHASWDGCTPCDLVFPFFLFCVGVSMTFALARYQGLEKEALKKIFKRGILLYLVGLAMAAFPFYPSVSSLDPELSYGQNYLKWLSEIRLLGVLPRIAMCYVAASVLALWLRCGRKIWAAIGVLSLLHVGLLVLFAGPEGAFSLEGNFARTLDLAVLGDGHMYHGYHNAEGIQVAFDPEGFLGVLTGTCTVLLGYLAGKMIRRTAPMEASCRLYTYAALSLLAGLVISIWIPVNKPLWSVSYVFWSGGWAMFVLAFLIYMIDVRGVETPFFPFKALGMNALALFVLSGLLVNLNWRYFHWDYTSVFGSSEGMSLLFALLYMLFHLAVAVFLYRKKIFIRL